MYTAILFYFSKINIDYPLSSNCDWRPNTVTCFSMWSGVSYQRTEDPRISRLLFFILELHLWKGSLLRDSSAELSHETYAWKLANFQHGFAKLRGWNLKQKGVNVLQGKQAQLFWTENKPAGYSSQQRSVGIFMCIFVRYLTASW